MGAPADRQINNWSSFRRFDDGAMNHQVRGLGIHLSKSSEIPMAEPEDVTFRSGKELAAYRPIQGGNISFNMGHLGGFTPDDAEATVCATR
jgi:hypothetical protein